ncbi:Hypothetical Protein FCC1311_030352 [Hondaea fermentalgiana]|uniref:GDP-fucose protein O-fucosyltransferase 2 n=1 Tax=Hondaea fermentalgiana TaxID=2315210 RepID=A0A2R5GDT3_9STRA|nr:Hypothetical Protein FCC1311_030352 [Hondaea fermentalgiana]|eukprot:GBG26813.1 Hypothetical Protein FCC1311_030352 [Hondaea fermentalgiana]
MTADGPSRESQTGKAPNEPEVSTGLRSFAESSNAGSKENNALDIDAYERSPDQRSPSGVQQAGDEEGSDEVEDNDGDDASDETFKTYHELAALAGIDLDSTLYRDSARWSRVPERYKLRHDEVGRFFLYQPSGGWGNQRLILRWAVLAANALNRTLVLPPVAPHANFYLGFNKFEKSQILHMGQVLDLDLLASRVYAGIRVHEGDMNEYENLIFRNRTWRMYEKPAAISFMQEKTINRRWSNEKADVVYWHKTGMWKCCATMDAQYYAFIQYGMEFSKTLQALALRAAAPMAPRYNAIHFRRGDSQIMERRSVHKYIKYHGATMRHMNKSLPLYIATDERDRALFRPFVTTYGFSRLVFPEDLHQDIIEPFLAKVPAAMRGDVRGFIDQIICLYAERWSGSALSTFSYVISAMRNKRLRRGKYFTKLKQRGGEENFLPRDPRRLA